MTDCQEYSKLHDKLILDYLTFSEYSRYKELADALGFEREKVELCTLLNPILRDKSVFNPIVESIRLLIRFIRGKECVEGECNG